MARSVSTLDLASVCVLTEACRTMAGGGASPGNGGRGFSFSALLIRFSSASSVISPSRARGRELLDDEVEFEAAWREQAADNLVSFRSVEAVMGKTVSCGENLSKMDWK